MKEYAKIENGRLVAMPLFTDGVCNMSPERAAWRQENGYHPVDRSVTPPSCDEGRCAVRTGWAYDADPPTKVVPVYTVEDISEAPLKDVARSVRGRVADLTGDTKDKLLERLAAAALTVFASFFVLTARGAEYKRYGELRSSDRVVVGPGYVSPMMWPGDWFIRVEGSVPGAPASSYLAPLKDMLARYAGASGVWRSYRLSAETDPVAIRYGDAAPGVTFGYRDPMGAVSRFESNTLWSSGAPGVVHVTATDTNGVVREAAVVMTPVHEGRVADPMASETNVTERYAWAANLFSKLALVSTADADMVDNAHCRTFDGRYGYFGSRTWKSPRQLSRFGSDGRIHTNEWEKLASPAGVRGWALKQNRDFFWKELQTNLWCFSSACHETAASCPASSGSGWRSMPYMAVAPHYVITAAHYSGANSDWGVALWNGHPRFVKSENDNDYCFAHVETPRVGDAVYASGGVSDIRLYRVRKADTIPDQCIARFAKPEVLRSLSPTMFAKSPCLTVNCHQTVSPYAYTGGSGTLYGWSAEPGASLWKSPYPDGITVPQQAADCVHMGHMYDSGDFFFLAAPSGRVVPLGQTMYLNDGGGLSGPSYLADGILESLSAMIRADSGGAEDLRYWEFADLWSGGVTNLVEDAQ